MNDRLIRMKQIIGCKAEGIEPIIPCSKSTFWELVKKGVLPSPIKLGRASYWKHSDLQRIVSGGINP